MGHSLLPRAGQGAIGCDEDARSAIAECPAAAVPLCYRGSCTRSRSLRSTRARITSRARGVRHRSRPPIRRAERTAIAEAAPPGDVGCSCRAASATEALGPPRSVQARHRAWRREEDPHRMRSCCRGFPASGGARFEENDRREDKSSRRGSGFASPMGDAIAEPRYRRPRRVKL